MALPVVDAITNSGAKSNADPWSWSHTCTGNDRVLVVTVGSYNQLPTGVTYNGVAMTQAQSATNGTARSSIWYLINPAAGANTVSVDFASGTYGEAGAISFTGANQDTQPDSSATENGTSATTNVLNLTTVLDNCIIVDMICTDTTFTNSDLARNGAQSDVITAQNLTFVDIGSSYKAIVSAGAQTMTWTWTVAAGSSSYAHVGLAVMPKLQTFTGYLKPNRLRPNAFAPGIAR